jgi:hypothetical protein
MQIQGFDDHKLKNFTDERNLYFERLDQGFLHPLGKHPETYIYRPGFEPRPPAQQAGTNGYGIVSWQLTHLSILIPTIFCY